MEFVQTIQETKNIIKEWEKSGFTIGLVPTMGFLHEGHESLIKKAASENDKVVVSIFVNPIQFGPTEDLDTYPRNLDRDKKVCENAGTNLIFNPAPEEMYFDNAVTSVTVGELTNGLCGSKRPIHFQGVCTVVSKLFNIVTPDKAYFGEKDAQQLAVIKRMVRDLNFDIDIIGCPIVREEDGLAKSSRNTYLSDSERKAALVLNESLKLAKKALENGEVHASKLTHVISEKINSEPLAKIDYIEIVDSIDLKPVCKISSSILVAIAVYIGKTRLIDNFTWNTNDNK
ncbi:pantothenate synthetase [Clostridium pasteurianum DSM 525 = ATCC 6013]|uniref:Pantothenate synthetase n=1 Tax=Clostridium pasteurianum DSM 525 = ATCC 6013 TaxID=1262449 RepID=A0A0H3J5L2_CLOPA|nr:pantoate--beta-alanine ligase [Clostridium pasteurianum]AJA49291.1 pantothenate synthetase [Clostridium pasteurianum DSM 525 = ATCC 6013]AJA53279.1 pantothenate synthetase [Clostridium pasteurianum DSM 525 = ATCC 6013]AOZ76469.1 pantoate--beta-alanine ligase [Clostridium pasteurianum DSM 525 = ATCC 6013]AOZ80266.1 pantoate--beta-alanine ligase [Clostridium pasteurianum]ELP58311.1 pantoate--beta-alanine ligase [Clostridium pasteurianum DSM 525 = ATCC 6013]